MLKQYGTKSKSSEINYKVVEKLGQLTADQKVNKELRVVSWNENEPKYDLRPWSINEDTGEDKPGKGITLTYDELIGLYNILKENMEEQ